jgi:hypothetical protein
VGVLRRRRGTPADARSVIRYGDRQRRHGAFRRAGNRRRRDDAGRPAGGAIWFFFTPHFSPLGSHLYDYIYIPWCHLLFRRGQLQGAIRQVLRQRDPGSPDGAIEQEVQRIMDSYDNDLNHMSIRRFSRIVDALPELQVSLRQLKPAKFSFLKWLTAVPLVRELITGTVVCRLERVG